MNYLCPIISWCKGKPVLRSLYTGDAYERSIDDTVKSCWATKRVDVYGNRHHDSLRSYLLGDLKPHYPVPAIDYYNSGHPNHVAIGNMMEWSIPVATQLQFRS